MHAELLFHVPISVSNVRNVERVSVSFVLCFVFQPKERGSTRVHALNNVNRVLQVLHQSNVSLYRDSGFFGAIKVICIVKSATCSVHRRQMTFGNIFLMRSIEPFL